MSMLSIAKEISNQNKDNSCLLCRSKFQRNIHKEKKCLLIHVQIIFLFICSSFNFIALFIYVIMNILNMKLTGFRSQCIILSRCNILRHWRREKANLRIKAILNPWKLFFLINSYKFILKRKKYTHNYTVNYKAAHLCKTEKASTHRAIVCGL